LQRQINFKNAMFPFKLLDSLFKSKRIIKDFKPDVVIGTGGFASGPLLQVANSTGVPTVVQEQNSYPGITNKLLSKKAGIICVAYENLERFFPKEKIVLTGNPVRQDLIDIDSKREEALTFFKLDSSKKTLLVLGGSLGSRRINQLIEKELEAIKSNNVQVIWQCGKLYFEEYKKYSDANVQVVAFIEKMDFVYAAADIIISRAGASSVSELCIVGKPVIFIPSPNVAEDHQTKNANAIVQKQGALLLKESSLDVEFGSVFDTLLKDEYQQQQLGQNIKRLALPQATSKIVDEIVKLIKK
jgi:UDP-N-acetylglucosamine--N-acetylmuramyl-(pentapeptide) pyrophosphoryl-undecaprenol N-acetylglucosamine transferase